MRQFFLTLQTLLQSLKGRGFIKTVLLVWDEWRFDRKYKLVTSGLVDVSDLDPVGDGKYLAEPYMPTAYSTFSELAEKLNDGLMDGTFIDFGSGKGRALILAGIFGFKKIIGVEFDKNLCLIAGENASRFIKQSGKNISIDVRNEDVRSFAIPTETNVFYFYNPFTKEVLVTVLKHIGESLKASTRPHVLAYVNPVCHEVFSEMGFSLSSENESSVGQKYNFYQLADAGA